MEAENIKIKPAPKDRKLSPSPFGNRLESAKFAVIRIDGLPVARLLTKHRHYTHKRVVSVIAFYEKVIKVKADVAGLSGCVKSSV